MDDTHNEFHSPKVNIKEMLKENSNSNSLMKLIDRDRDLELSTKLGKTLYSIKEVQTQNAAKVELIEMKTNALVSLLNEQIKSSAKIQSYTFRKLKFAELFLGIAIIILFFTLYVNKDSASKIIHIPAVVHTKRDYVSLKYLNLRVHPTKSARKIITLAPNQRIKLLESKLGWFKVNYKDYSKNKTITGWVWSEHLQKIK
jgi:hypothetical protein